MPGIRKRQPLISLGLLLILISVAPTIIGMTTAFHQANRGEDSSATLRRWVALSFHPAFIACSTIGLLLLFAGVIRLTLRKDRA